MFPKDGVYIWAVSTRWQLSYLGYFGLIFVQRKEEEMQYNAFYFCLNAQD